MKVFFQRLIRMTSHTRDFELYFGGNPSAPNVLIFTEHLGATYFLTFDQPLRSLHARGTINFAVVSKEHMKFKEELCWQRWASEFRPDIVVLTRYSETNAFKILDFFRQNGIPVIYHIDDDLLSAPQRLGQNKFEYSNDPVRLKTVDYLLKNCDLIYASTLYLANLLKERFPDQRIFNGIYPPYLAELIKPAQITTRTNQVIGYMGTKGHKNDLKLVVPVLERLLDERTDLEFEVFGSIKMPDALKRFGSRVRSHSAQNSYTDFLSTLAGLGWDIGLAPLVDDTFNRCKSATKFIEYTACGIPIVASKLNMYEDAIPENGGLLVDQDWYEPLVEFLDDPQRRQNALSISQRHCASKHSLQAVQEQLIKILQDTPAEHSRPSSLHEIRYGYLVPKFLRTLSSVYRMLSVNNPEVPGSQSAPMRLLIVANGIIPTVYVSFLNPLAKLIDSGECSIDFLTVPKIKKKLAGTKWRTPEQQAWIKYRCRASNPTHIVFIRYSGSITHANAILSFSREQGLPSIYCIDDDLLNIPRELGQKKFEFHNDPARLKTVRYLLRDVDLVYCSNTQLKNRLHDYGLIRNIKTAEFFCAGEIISPAKLRPVRTIGYMGFDHEHDFKIVLPSLISVLRKHPELSFELFGKIPKPAVLDEFKERIIVLPAVSNYDEFMRILANRKWDIGICPLALTDFNLVKNINKWVEYTAVGAAVIATHRMIYDECCADGCGLLVDENNWESALISLVEHPVKRFEQVRNAQFRLSENYSVKQLRKQVQSMLTIASEVSQNFKK
jgi:glycosyltransferase involved in cell wall biosynthesis